MRVNSTPLSTIRSVDVAIPLRCISERDQPFWACLFLDGLVAVYIDSAGSCPVSTSPFRSSTWLVRFHRVFPLGLSLNPARELGVRSSISLLIRLVQAVPLICPGTPSSRCITRLPSEQWSIPTRNGLEVLLWKPRQNFSTSTIFFKQILVVFHIVWIRSKTMMAINMKYTLLI